MVVKPQTEWTEAQAIVRPDEYDLFGLKKGTTLDTSLLLAAAARVLFEPHSLDTDLALGSYRMSSETYAYTRANLGIGEPSIRAGRIQFGVYQLSTGIWPF